MEGSITMNGHERNISQFRKLSAYIMQDNQLHANLTVDEAMNVATNLKLGADIKNDERDDVVRILMKSPPDLQKLNLNRSLFDNGVGVDFEIFMISE